MLPVRALIRLWNTELRLEVTLLEAPDPASRLPSNWLSADSLARLVSAATVETMLAVAPAVELELLVLAVVPKVAGATLLMLPIDIMVPIALLVVGLSAGS